MQVEAQFACRRITSQRSKFDYVVSSLAPEFAGEVRDLLVKPPSVDPYTTLKAQLTKRTTVSEQKKLQQLFTSEELGGRKPTQLLRRMQQLLGNRPGMTDDSFLRELFLQRLPPNVRMVLASSPEGTGLEQLAELADKVMEVAAPNPPPVAAVNTAPPLATEIERLHEQVTRLQTAVQQLARSRSTSRPNSCSSRRSQTPPPTSSDTPAHTDDSSPDALCWYHHKFGERARQSRPPCAWKSNSSASR